MEGLRLVGASLRLGERFEFFFDGRVVGLMKFSDLDTDLDDK